MEIEPEIPALIYAPEHKFECPLIPLPVIDCYFERMDDHYSPGPNYWRACDRLIDRSGQVYTIHWKGPDEELKELKTYSIKPEKIITNKEIIKIIEEHHSYLGINSSNYLKLINSIEEAEVIQASINYVNTIPKSIPLLSSKQKLL